MFKLGIIPNIITIQKSDIVPGSFVNSGITASGRPGINGIS